MNFSQLIPSLLENYKNSSSYWSGSYFEEVVKLSTDGKGKFGEQLIFELIKKHTEFPVQWDEDSNTNNGDGVYDLWWVGHSGTKKRVEVKSSGRTVSNGKSTGWQHENIYYTDNKWDNVIFMDYDANDIVFITIVSYDQIVTDEVIDLTLFGKKAHQRKNEQDKAKVDFSMKSIHNGIKNGVTFMLNMQDPNFEGLSKFFRRTLGE